MKDYAFFERLFFDLGVCWHLDSDYSGNLKVNLNRVKVRFLNIFPEFIVYLGTRNKQVTVYPSRAFLLTSGYFSPHKASILLAIVLFPFPASDNKINLFDFDGSEETISSTICSSDMAPSRNIDDCWTELKSG